MTVQTSRYCPVQVVGSMPYYRVNRAVTATLIKTTFNDPARDFFQALITVEGRVLDTTMYRTWLDLVDALAHDTVYWCRARIT